jgi:CRISPR-associated protein Csd1
MVDNSGNLTYSPLRLLIKATQRDPKPREKQKTDLNSKTRIGTILWNAAVKGHSYKLPLEVMQYVLNRIWKKDEFSKERATLIKLVINRNTNKHMKSTLDEANTSIAYLCGRLFAVIESMQWKAMGNVNSGVKDRFFAAAAAQPTILGTLLTKNVPIYQHKIGGYMAKELNEIAGKISEIGSFPQRFSAIEQGEFALGYYFQKNHKKETTDSNN